MSEFINNAIFWIEVEKIKPNPYQPRKEFDEAHLRDLADSIRQYGVLQPLVVTRSEVELPEGGMVVEYELIAGERRLRASKLAGLLRVPAIIQAVTDPRLKLELAIIENLQREDLNPVDRAISFARLAQEFSLKHTEIAKKVGKSREYVSNTLRLLVLPKEILDALAQGRITEGHARPLMMLTDRKEEQNTLYKEILFKKLTVREAEQIARHIAKERVRSKIPRDPEMELIEKELAETLGTRVSIERRQVGGGKLVIDFFSSDDLRALLDKVHFSEQLSLLRNASSAISDKNKAMKKLEESTPIRVSYDSINPRDEHPSAQFATPQAPFTPVDDAALDHLDSFQRFSTDISDDEHLGPEDDVHVPAHVLVETKKNDESEDDSLYSVSNFAI